MSVNVRFQLRCIANTALICAFASSALILVLQRVLSMSLGHDYGAAFLALKQMDESLFFIVMLPILFYLFLTSILVVFFKVVISHKIAGPLYRLEMCAASIGRGDYDFATRLRGGDQLGPLASDMGTLREHLSRPLKEADEILKKAEAALGKAGAGEAEGPLDRRQLQDLERELDDLVKALRAQLSGMPQA